MIGSYALGIVGVLLVAGRVVFDLGYKRGYAQGVTRTTSQLQAAAVKSFEQGQDSAHNWWIAADFGAEAERRVIWKEEEKADE